jgi:GNAT superfamily N-acetyltransferase
MQACRSELTISPAFLERNPAFVLLRDQRPIGFYGLERLSASEAELSHLFVDPGAIGCGYGRRLVAHACRVAREHGYSALEIQSDPHAERFYAACGARRVGSKESASIPGRSLPLLALDLGGA